VYTGGADPLVRARPPGRPRLNRLTSFFGRFRIPEYCSGRSAGLQTAGPKPRRRGSQRL